MDIQFSTALNNVTVRTTNNRGRTPEELADEAMDKVLYVGENVHPAIRDQAQAYREQIRALFVYYMRQAIVSDRTTLSAKLKSYGHADLVKLLEN
jgi:hypothetical protein